MYVLPSKMYKSNCKLFSNKYSNNCKKKLWYYLCLSFYKAFTFHLVQDNKTHRFKAFPVPFFYFKRACFLFVNIIIMF